MEIIDNNFNDEVKRIHSVLDDIVAQNKNIVATSSFQTQSLPLLHILSTYSTQIPIAFIDTGYLFPETYRFRDKLIKQMNLKVVNIDSTVPMSGQLSSNNKFLFSSSPEKCCQLNKIDPINVYLKRFDVWISGVRADQSQARKELSEFQENKDGIMRYHPMLSWNSKMVYLYRKKFNLPEHPLESSGYISVGCMPCTAKFIDTVGQERSGRWSGMNKDECGLHTNLA